GRGAWERNLVAVGGTRLMVLGSRSARLGKPVLSEVAIAFRAAHVQIPRLAALTRDDAVLIPSFPHSRSGRQPGRLVGLGVVIPLPSPWHSATSFRTRSERRTRSRASS